MKHPEMNEGAAPVENSRSTLGESSTGQQPSIPQTGVESPGTGGPRTRLRLVPQPAAPRRPAVPSEAVAFLIANLDDTRRRKLLLSPDDTTRITALSVARARMHGLKPERSSEDPEPDARVELAARLALEVGRSEDPERRAAAKVLLSTTPVGPSHAHLLKRGYLGAVDAAETSHQAEKGQTLLPGVLIDLVDTAEILSKHFHDPAVQNQIVYRLQTAADKISRPQEREAVLQRIDGLFTTEVEGGKKVRRTISDETRAQVKALARRGYSNSEISRNVRLSPKRVSDILRPNADEVRKPVVEARLTESDKAAIAAYHTLRDKRRARRVHKVPPEEYAARLYAEQVLCQAQEGREAFSSRDTAIAMGITRVQVNRDLKGAKS